jgi:hypothetical protein
MIAFMLYNLVVAGAIGFFVKSLKLASLLAFLLCMCLPLLALMCFDGLIAYFLQEAIYSGLLGEGLVLLVFHYKNKRNQTSVL